MPSGDSTAELLRAFREAARAKIARDLQAEDERAEQLKRLVLPAVAGAVEHARRQSLCNRAWLFGSFAWGKPTDRSDVDVLVEGDAEALAALIQDACRRDLHVLTLDEAPASLRDRVLAEGLPL